MKRLTLALFAVLALSLGACDTEPVTAPAAAPLLDGGNGMGSGAKTDSTTNP